MKVYVKVFATLRENMVPKPGIGEKIEMECEPGTTVRDLALILKLPIDEIAVIFKNHVHTKIDDTVKDGDVFGIFPLVGGG